jgi:transposase
MIQEDARRCLELDEKIKRLAEVAKRSTIVKTLRSIPGFGAICTSELAGEIGTIERFGSEGSLSLYVGMSTLDNSSGKYQGTKAPKHSRESSDDDRRGSATKVCAGVAGIL